MQDGSNQLEHISRWQPMFMRAEASSLHGMKNAEHCTAGIGHTDGDSGYFSRKEYDTQARRRKWTADCISGLLARSLQLAEQGPKTSGACTLCLLDPLCC